MCKTLDKVITGAIGVKREKVISQRLSLMRHLSENWMENETGSAQEELKEQPSHGQNKKQKVR